MNCSCKWMHVDFFVFQTWMSVQMGHTCATTMLTVTTPWAHIAAHARMDFLEMDSSALVIYKTPFLYYSIIFYFKMTYEGIPCLWAVFVWSLLQTPMSVQRTATCVRVATVWTCQEATAVIVTWASSPLLMARPARVRQYSTALPDLAGSSPLAYHI